MASNDAAFAGRIPELYDRCLVPLLFDPYAEELARRLAEVSPATILETAAGTGAVTARIAAAVPHANVVATDLNPDMLAVARVRVTASNVSFEHADAQALPFEDGRFDAMVCQFGVMFYPDRAAGYREARRVLQVGAPYFFAVWGKLEANPISAVLHEAVVRACPANPPDFLARVPFGYSDRDQIHADVRQAGFKSVEIETVHCRSRAASADDIVSGLCQGTPLAVQIEANGPGAMSSAITAARAALCEFEDSEGAIDAPMSALLITVRA
jgi:ubiquinone/menaquinone biosynthesis C-methylase UbiE